MNAYEKYSPLAQRLICSLALVTAWSFSNTAQAVDWAKVPSKDVPLFYPGQGSWEWVMTEKDHSGAPKFRQGKNCRGCHEGEQNDMGVRIVRGEKLEPHPIAGKPGGIKLKVQIVHDLQKIHFRFQWTASTAASTKLQKNYNAMVTVMFDDAKIKEASRAGCWAACHDDAVGMASTGASTNRTKYLGASRTKLSRTGGGDGMKTPDELSTLLQQGVFLEYLQARLNPGQPAKAIDGYVLEKRHEIAGSSATALASFKNGVWVVEISRSMKAVVTGQKSFTPGTPYSLGFAVHDDFSNHRYHFVSFEYSMMLDQGKADFIATKLE